MKKKEDEVGTKKCIFESIDVMYLRKKITKNIRSPFMSLKVELVMLGDGSRGNGGISIGKLLTRNLYKRFVSLS